MRYIVDHRFELSLRPQGSNRQDLGILRLLHSTCVTFAMTYLNDTVLRYSAKRCKCQFWLSDCREGWRENKAKGGILIDVASDEIVQQGLSIPHSPRWYGNRLWLLESGQSSLVTIEPLSGQRQTVAQLPGFTRGLDFYGSLAFIGLSQVRETGVFSGIPITEAKGDRICGVWVVNIQTGETLAFLRFEDAVQEIFAVRVLPGIRFPEIIDFNEELLATSYVLPDEALAEVANYSQG